MEVDPFGKSVDSCTKPLDAQGAERGRSLCRAHRRGRLGDDPASLRSLHVAGAVYVAFGSCLGAPGRDVESRGVRVDGRGGAARLFGTGRRCAAARGAHGRISHRHGAGTVGRGTDLAGQRFARLGQERRGHAPWARRHPRRRGGGPLVPRRLALGRFDRGRRLCARRPAQSGGRPGHRPGACRPAASRPPGRSEGSPAGRRVSQTGR